MIRKATVLILVVLMIVGGWFAWKKLSAPEETAFYQHAVNINAPMRVSEKIYFFTGSSFAAYDLKNFKTERVSDYFYTTGDINKLFWSESSVIFSVSGADSNDSFGQAVVKSGEHVASSYWWRFNLNTKQIELLLYKDINTCSELLNIGELLYCFSVDLNNTYRYTLRSYDIASGQIAHLAVIDGAVKFMKVYGGNIYYVTSQPNGGESLYRFSVNDKKSDVLYKSKVRILSFAANGGGNILINNAEPLSNTPAEVRTARDEPDDYAILKQDLVYLDANGDELDSKSFSAPTGIVEAGDNKSLHYVAQNGVSFIAEAEKLTKDAAFYGKDLIFDVWSVGAEKYYVNRDGVLRSTAKKNSGKISGADFVENKNLPANLFFIRSVKNGVNEAILFDFQKDFKSNSEDIDAFLRNLGYDPNQFNFKWGIEGFDGDIKITDTTLVRR